MPKNPKITAILPCFNHAQFLEERIHSIFAQTHPVDQIVFLDDASTDSSVDIAKRLLREFNGQVDFCLRSVNSGSPFVQWNEGVRLAKHDLVWIAETDDSCDARLIEILYSAILDSQAVIGYSQSRYIAGDGQDLGSALHHTDRFWSSTFRNSFSMEGAQFNWRYMTGLNAIPNAGSVLFRKDAYVSAGCANETMRFCGDWDAWIRICAIGRVEFVSDELNYFRCHASTSRSAGFTPSVAAEYFACRLVACIGVEKSRRSSLSAFDLIQGLLDPRKRWQWDQAVQSLSLASLSEARSRYQELNNFPVLSDTAWLTLQILFVCEAFAKRVSSLSNKLICKPSRFLLWLIRYFKYRF